MVEHRFSLVKHLVLGHVGLNWLVLVSVPAVHITVVIVHHVFVLLTGKLLWSFAAGRLRLILESLVLLIFIFTFHLWCSGRHLGWLGLRLGLGLRLRFDIGLCGNFFWSSSDWRSFGLGLCNGLSRLFVLWRFIFLFHWFGSRFSLLLGFLSDWWILHGRFDGFLCWFGFGLLLLGFWLYLNLRIYRC